MKADLLKIVSMVIQSSPKPFDGIVLSIADADAIHKEMGKSCLMASNSTLGPLWTWKIMGVPVAVFDVENSYFLRESAAEKTLLTDLIG